VQLVVVLQDRDVGERVTVDEQQVGQVAGLNLAQLVGLQHDLPAECGGGQDGFHGGEAEQLDGIRALARQTLAHVGQAQYAQDFRIQPRDDFLCRARRRLKQMAGASA
jgi:hypothetical protein